MNGIFFPKQLAELLSILLALIFFCNIIFLRTIRSTYTNENNEIILNIYTRMIAITFATNCVHLILIITRCDWTAVRLLHALDGYFFALIAHRLEDVKPLKVNTIDLNMEEI